MEKINFDNGIREYQINGSGVLRFNPSDPNVYTRFLDAMDQIRSMEGKMADRAREIEQETDREKSGAAVLRLMTEADREVKALLHKVFGEENDFNVILGGVNLLAVAGNGQRVLTNLLEALQPVMLAGAEACARQQADAAVAKARLNRAQRRAQ